MYYRGNGFPKRKSGHLLGVIGIYIVLLACVFAAWGQEGDIVHAHYYYDFEVGKDKNGDPNPPLRIYSWHEHKDVIRDGHVTYDDWSHHGARVRNTKTQNGDGHDGPVDKPDGPEQRPQPRPQPRRSTRSDPEQSPEVELSRGGEETERAESPEPELEYVPPSPTCDADFSVSGIICYNWQIEDRYQLIGFPILPSFGIDTVGWLHYYLERKLQRRDILFQALVDGCWLSYRGGGRNEVNPEIGNIKITPHFGIMINFKRSEKTVGFLGTHQYGEVIDLEPGTHLIGLPEVPANYQRASNFLSVDGVEWVKIGYGDPQKIDSVDDPDDQDLQAGQAIQISVTEGVTLDLRGLIPETAAAPSVRRKGTLATSWGAMKR